MPGQASTQARAISAMSDRIFYNFLRARSMRMKKKVREVDMAILLVAEQARRVAKECEQGFRSDAQRQDWRPSS